MDSAPMSSPLHALVLPYPTQGHITPMKQFAKNLASRSLTVTFVTTHHTHARITQADSAVKEARNPSIHIRSAQISDGLPLDFDRSANFLEFMCSVDNMGAELEQLIQNLNKTGHPISCVIADSLLFWSLDVTKKFGIPWISFWTQLTSVYSIYYHAHLLEDHHQSLHEGSGSEDNILIDHIPGVPTLHSRDLPSFFRERDGESVYALDLLLKSVQACREADWVLCNSFDELERPAVNAVSLEHPILLVGPQLPSGYFKDKSTDEDMRVGTSIWTEYDTSAWLDTKPNRSVIYVSFGSMTQLSNAQLVEMAMALKDSGQPFLWVLRPTLASSTVSDSLPDGFLEEMGSQCLVVPWCNQLRVLSHPSVAGFITHCGWNSMLESIALGIPMIGLPSWSEQYTNCKLMADEWKLGFRLKEPGSHTGDKKLTTREDICRAVRKLFSDQEKEIKKNAEWLRDSAKTAMLEGGSSHNNIESFVVGLKARCVKLSHCNE
eukprot:PITA_28533